MSKLASIGIEGWGDPVEGLPYRLRRSHAGDAGSSVIPALLLADYPTSLSERAQYHAGWSTRGNISFPVMHLDGTIGATLRRWLWQANPEPVGRLAADVTAAALSLTAYTNAGKTWPATPFDLYLEREVLTVSAVAGAGGGAPYTLTVTRGVYGSSPAAHYWAIDMDAHVYTVNPIVEGRRVTRYDYDTATDTETAVFQGLLMQPGGLSESMIVCDLEAESALGYFSSEKMVGDGRYETVGYLLAESGRVRGKLAPYDRLQARARSTVDDHLTMVVTDGTTIRAVTAWTTGWDAQLVQTAEPGLRGPLYGTVGADSNDFVPLWECLICDADSSMSMVRNEDGSRSDHPLDLLLNIMTSTGTTTWPAGGAHTVGSNGDYDWLPAHFGLGIPVGMIDVASIATLRNNDLYLSGLRCRNFVLSEKCTAPELIGRILLPLGLWPSTSATGLITLAQIRDFADADADATLTDSDLSRRMTEQPWAEMERYGKIRIDLGHKGLSDSYSLQITDTDFSSYLSNRFPYGVPSLVIDGGDYGDPDTHSISDSVKESLRQINLVRWTLAVQRLPTYVAEFKASSASRLPPGSKVLLTNRVAVGDDGNRGVTTRRCIVIEQTYDEELGDQTLTMVDLYPVTRASRVVCPTWRIDSVVDAGEQTVSAAEFTDDDWSEWYEEAVGVLCDRTGAPKSTARLVNITAGTVIPDGDWDVIPIVGDLLRVADYDDSVGYWYGCAWIADADAALGAADDAPARWSF